MSKQAGIAGRRRQGVDGLDKSSHNLVRRARVRMEVMEYPFRNAGMISDMGMDYCIHLRILCREICLENNPTHRLLHRAAPALARSTDGGNIRLSSVMTATAHLPRRIEIIDSHTAGEPTRCVLSGGPHLGTGPMAERLGRLRTEHDFYRRAILCEPRGSDVLVGALLVEPVDPASAAGVIFFNNAGYLGMCGHGTIGVAATLLYLGQIGLGKHIFETPVGNVSVSISADGNISIGNVDAYRHCAHVPVVVPGFGTLYGDIAWGGNWFFLVEEHPFELVIDRVEELTDFTWRVRRALEASGITGANGAEIDHIELFSAAHDSANDSRNFVLCPGKAYDRSPCGTGTSAKMACLAADGKLESGQLWRQEGILDSVFTGSIERVGERIIPRITGTAHVTAETTLVFQPDDPFRAGIPAAAGSAQ